MSGNFRWDGKSTVEVKLSKDKPSETKPCDNKTDTNTTVKPVSPDTGDASSAALLITRVLSSLSYLCVYLRRLLKNN